MAMHWRTFTSTLVWVAVLCFARVVSEFTSELADKLNMLVCHPGWRDGMHNVKILINDGKDTSDPMSAILQAIDSNRNPVDESNVLVRYNEIGTMLMCKYAEIIYKHKILVQNYVRVCRHERQSCDYSAQRYQDCFRLLLAKLHGVSTSFKCMQDALKFFHALGAQSDPEDNEIMIATEELTKYTSTVGPETSAKLSAHGVNMDVVDFEINNIKEYFKDIHEKVVYLYIRKHCIIPKYTEWTTQKFIDAVKYKKSNQLIPKEMTMLQYVVNELDCYVSEILSRWFFNLGFAYGVKGKVMIGIN